MSVQVIVPSPQQRAHDLAIAYTSMVAPTSMPTAESTLQRCERAYVDAYNRCLDLFLKQESTESQSNQ